MKKFSRISTDPSVMGGVPCIRDVRIPVSVVIKLCSEGCSVQEICDLYPDLGEQDIREALAFAASSVETREMPLPA